MFFWFLKSSNRRFVFFSLVILFPWLFVFLARYAGPIQYVPVDIELLVFFFSVIFFTYIAFLFGYASVFTKTLSDNYLYHNTVGEQGDISRVFRFVRAVVVFIAILYPIISFIDFFLVKGATFSTIIEQRESEHATGPRNSLIGALGALLSGSPPVLFVLLLFKKFKSKWFNYLLYLFVFLGFLSMFLSGGRNAFFISIFFVFFYRLFFIPKKTSFSKKTNLKSFIFGFFLLYGLFFSMKMFLDRFEAQGFDVNFMLDYLEREYDILIYRIPFDGEMFVSLYSVFVYLVFYISHSFTYLNEYFLISYSPYLGGAYNFPQVVRLVDVVLGTDLFSLSRDKVLLVGVYLTLPGSLYLDFGWPGTIVVCSTLAFIYGRLSFNLFYLNLFQKLFFAYLSVVLIFSPVYGLFGMANGFSLIFILFLVFLFSIKLLR